MSTMRDFTRNGMLHWELNGESPCGERPAPTPKTNMIYTVLFAFGHRERASANIVEEDCPTCIPTRDRYFKFMRNGGWMRGWEIHLNEERSDRK